MTSADRRATVATTAPRLDVIRLADLTDGDPKLIEPHEQHEGQRFPHADLDGRALTGASFSECEFHDLSAHETDLRFATFAETAFVRLNAPVFLAARSRFRDVTIEASRLGSAELYDASWQSVHISNCKLGFVNLRGATLQDVLFTDCTIDELDLGGAKANRVAFTRTDVNNLDVTRANLSHVDLRGLEMRHLIGLEGLKGATLNFFKIAELAPILAGRLGIKVED